MSARRLPREVKGQRDFQWRSLEAVLWPQAEVRVLPIRSHRHDVQISGIQSLQQVKQSFITPDICHTPEGLPPVTLVQFMQL